jgi:hypothetical protein
MKNRKKKKSEKHKKEKKIEQLTFIASSHLLARSMKSTFIRR